MLRTPDLFDQMLHSLIVKAHAIDDGAVFYRTEQSGFGVAVLRFGCDRTDFDKAEPAGGQRINVITVLIQPGGKANPIGKSQPHNFQRR